MFRWSLWYLVLLLLFNSPIKAVTKPKATQSCRTLPSIYLNKKAPSHVRPFSFLTTRELRAMLDAMERHGKCVAWVIVRRDREGNTIHMHVQWEAIRRLK
jgi:hypothetical protein